MLVLLLLSVLSTLRGGSDPQRASASDPGYVLHEWGTFTTIAGSNGVVLEGLAYDDHQLPDFVYQRAQSRPGFDGARCKMETPVLYFYSEREREVSVRVGFQQGILTQWYPQVHGLVPPASEELPALRGGVLDWGKIRVLAPGQALGRLPAVGRAVHWERARDVDANVVMGHVPTEEYERFLFYRGLGSFALRLSAWTDDHGALHLANRSDEPLAGAIVLARAGGHLRAKRLEPMARGREERVRQDEIRPIDLAGAMELTARLLEEQGLYPREARAMVNTWQESYFETDGLRVLCPLPRAEVDWLLPLSVSPPPRECVRVLVARIDVLTPEAEQRALAMLPRIRTAEEARAELGRFAVPLLSRLAWLAESGREREHVQELQRLLELSF
jgi:hypothetical protein